MIRMTANSNLPKNAPLDLPFERVKKQSLASQALFNSKDQVNEKLMGSTREKVLNGLFDRAVEIHVFSLSIVG